MSVVKIFAFAGSARQDSLNKKLIKVAAQLAREQGAEVDLIDLNDYPMPLYHGDLEKEKGLPENALKLKQKMLDADGFIFSCPEYNSSITPLLKNTLDWISRPDPNSPNSNAYSGKIVSLLSASPGRLGGMRGLVHVRQVLTTLGCVVLPNQHALPSAGQAFDDQGRLKEGDQHNRVVSVVQDCLSFCQKM